MSLPLEEMTREPEGREHRSEDFRIHACTRILQYGQGLGLPAEACLELAEECLRRIGAASDLGRIMAAMHHILAEKGMGIGVIESDGGPLRSFPPLLRRSMVSNCPDCLSFSAWLWRKMVGVFVKKKA